MTPSLPTVFIAPAMISPISWSPLAEMVPTWATEPSPTGFDNLPSAPPSHVEPRLCAVVGLVRQRETAVGGQRREGEQKHGGQGERRRVGHAFSVIRYNRT